MSVKKYLSVLIIGGLLSLSYAGYITPQLQSILDTLSVGRKTFVCVHLLKKPDMSRFAHKDYARKIAYLKEFTALQQRPVLSLLEGYGGQVSKIKAFWVFNGISCQATKPIIQAAAVRTDIEFVSGGPLAGINEPVGGNRPPDFWNVPHVRATECWNNGYTGDDIVLCIFDTGMLIDHVSYGDEINNWKWRNVINGSEHWEYAWFDPHVIYHHDEPYDFDEVRGHGTHVGGITVGGDGIAGSGLPDIGVAPGAKLIACTYIGDDGEYFHECFEWIASLAAVPGNLAPDVVNCSWGNPWEWNSQEFWGDVQTLRQLDIIPVCAIGNNTFPYPLNTPPGNFPTVIGVGATDRYDVRASFSCTGPAPDEDPWRNPTFWPRPDWNRMAVDLMAPGMSDYGLYEPGGINSADRNNPNEYKQLFGTSQATPHVTGVIALMQEAAMDYFGHKLDYYDIFDILVESADPVGQAVPNTDYGWGRLDCKAACDSVVAYRRKSTSAEAVAGNNQRKLIYDPANNIVHLVYETRSYIRYTYSTDRGATWSKDEKIGDGVCPCIALDGSANLHCIFKDGATIRYNCRLNDQWLVEPPVIYADFETWDISGPSFVIDGSLGYVALEAFGCRDEIRYGTFTTGTNPPPLDWITLDYREGWSRFGAPALGVNDVAINVVYAIPPTGTCSDVWEVVLRSSDNNWNLLPVSKEDARNSYNQALVVADNKTWIFWEDEGDIYYRVRTSSGWEEDPAPVSVSAPLSVTPRAVNPLNPGEVFVAWSEYDTENSNWEILFSRYEYGWQTPIIIVQTPFSDSRDPDVTYIPDMMLNDKLLVGCAEGNEYWSSRGKYLPLYQLHFADYYFLFGGGAQGKEKPMKATYGIESIYPAPVRKEAIIRYRAKAGQVLDLRLYDAGGRQVRKQMVTVVAGMNEISIRRENLPAGTYFLRFDNQLGSKLEKIVFLK